MSSIKIKYNLPVNTTPEEDGGVKIRRDSLLPLPLKNYEAHFNWLQGMNLNIIEIENGIIVLEEKFQDEAREIDSLLKTSGIKLISKKATEAFFQLENNNVYRAKCNIDEAKSFVKTCLENNFFSEEYADGFKYVFDGLEIYLQVKAGWKPLGSFLDALIEFPKVPPKGKVTIWAMKDFFLEECRQAFVDRRDYMTKILELEPCTIKWHFHLYKASRNTKKLKLRPAPYGHEKVIPDDPLILSYVCYCLAEILTIGLSTMEEDELYMIPRRFGIYTFQSPKEIASKILEKTMKILGMDCKLDQVYLNLAEIHMYKMPERYQNTEIALSCLERALKLNPNSSTGHHRMGVLQLKLRNHKQAGVHLRKVLEKDGTINIGAVYGLLQLLMSAPLKNSVEINSIFKVYMGNPNLTHEWDKRCLRTLHYLKGCFLFMQENKEEEAITKWIIAHDNGSSKWSYYFLHLPYQSHRFGWPTKKLNLNNVSNTLKHAAYIERTQFKQVLLDICSEVDDAIRRDTMSPIAKNLVSSSSSSVS